MARRLAERVRTWPARRVALAAVAGLLVVTAAWLGGQGPVGAQDGEGEAAGEPKTVAEVRISGLSGTLTYGGSDGFTVTASNLTTVVGYDVIVSRNNGTLGIGACGTGSQTQRVSGVTSQNLSFTVRACAAGSGTVTAVVRRTGLTTNEDAASQGVTVQARAPAAPARPTAPNPQAREFTAQWQAPGDTGGTALTGYHVIMRPNGAAWPPDREAKKVGATTRRQRFSGLTPNRIYWFKVKACNGANQTRCSGWSPQASVTLPIGTPEKPTWGSFTAETTQIRVTWSAPGDTGGVGLTGYGLRHWRKGATEPSSAQVVVNAQTSSRTFGGLAPNTGYRFSIQACNGPSRCSGWTNKDGTTKPTPTPPAQAPERVGQPSFSEIGSTAFTVTWSPPRDNGTAIRGYGIQWRQSGSGWPSTTTWRGASARSERVDNRAAGTTYVVRVKACNGTGANGRNRCGAWSRDGRVTTLATTAPAPTDPTAPIAPVHASCPETSSTETAAGPPQNLDVVPESDRRILLCWSPVTPVKDKTSYLVQVTLDPTADSDDDRAWVAARANNAKDTGPASSTDTAVIVDLTNVLLHLADRGLTTQHSIGFRIRARISSSRYEYSDMVVVVDSPIVAASVFRSNREEAHVSWRTAQTVLLDDDYAHGTYDLRYQLVRGNRQDRNWKPTDLGSRADESGVSSPHVIRELDGNSIYAIQWVYRKDNRTSTDDADVYAARTVYLQTIDGAPVAFESSGPVVFAGFPMQYPLKTTTFEYRVCTETFPAGQATTWTDFIKHAFAQWELATNFTVISMKYSSDPCTDYATTDVTATILKKIRDHTGSNEDLTTVVKSFIRRATTMTKLRPLHHADSRLNEVLMLDDVEALGLGPAFKSRVVWVYSQLGSDIGYLGSEDPKSVSRECWTEHPGCAVPTLIVDSDGVGTGDGYSTDIFLLRSKATGGLLLPGGDTSVDRSDVRLNQCPAGTSDTYGVLIHEAGHALGLRSADGSDVHPQWPDSVMAGGDYGNKCSPYPIDVLAIRALYETR